MELYWQTEYWNILMPVGEYRLAKNGEGVLGAWKMIGVLFEYFNSLQLIERRFFQNSQCGHVFFTWYDSINGVESTQKSIQFEKASILFNCATLYTQLAAICCDGNEQKHEEQMIYWQKAAGCLKFLTTNFSKIFLFLAL